MQSTSASALTSPRMERSPTIPYAEQPHTRLAEGEFRAGFAVAIFPSALPVCIVQHTESQASVHGLAPLNFRRRVTRPVSYYALF